MHRLMHMSFLAIGPMMIMSAKHCIFGRYINIKSAYLCLKCQQNRSYVSYNFIYTFMLQGTKGKWKRCNYDIPFKTDISNSFQYHANLSRKGYRSLIYRSTLISIFTLFFFLLNVSDSLFFLHMYYLCYFSITITVKIY